MCDQLIFFISQNVNLTYPSPSDMNEPRFLDRWFCILGDAALEEASNGPHTRLWEDGFLCGFS